jgi:peptidoglycan hydrolase FlgJ
MLPTPPASLSPSSLAPTKNGASTLQAPTNSEESKLRFEQLLWAELLTHTGLEKSMTLGGGEGASMFARYFVEAIAADIAKQHPLGLLDGADPAAMAAPAGIGKGDTDNG